MLYQLGGWSPPTVADPHTHSQVRRSFDGGRTWERLPDAPWEGRHTAGWLVHNGKLWVIGGDVNSGHYQRDVWCGTPHALGITWEAVTANAAPLADGRTLHQVFSHAGKMWIAGGQTLDDLPSAPASPPSTKPGSPYYDDVWCSEDGLTWTLVSTGNPWAPCGLIIGSPVKDGYMWLFCGGAYNTEGNPRVFGVAAWRSADGVNWELVSADIGITPRQYHNVIVFKNQFVLMCGYSNSGNLADVHASSDGASWRSLGLIPGAARHAASLCEYNGELLLMFGPLDDTAVWAMH